MSTPLLSTKIQIPRVRPDLVSRPGLVERLAAGLDRKLTLVSAPAGFGKTTLLGRWSGNSERAVAWVSLDQGDNDPVRFWTYLVASLQTIDASIGKTALAALQSPESPPIDTVLTGLINQFAALSGKVILVLDDYHFINNQAIHLALNFLLDHLPRQLHLIILARSDPPLPLARLRGRGELNEIREPDLRFTPDEAGAFLNQVMGLDLDPAAVATLEKRTEGWVVGLQLAALALQRQADTAGFITAFAGDHRYIIDYLTDEVLDRQPEAVQTFLLQTSILDRLSGPLCDALLEPIDWNQGMISDGGPAPITSAQAPSQGMLVFLAQNNLFLIPMDERRQWYRYHHLFADLLRYRLRQTHPDRVSSLHQRASAWFTAHDLIEEAVHHALAGEDFFRAAELIEAVVYQLTGQGRIRTAKQWLERLPRAILLERPLLCISLAWALNFAGQVQKVEPCLQDAESSLLSGSVDQHTAAEIRGNAAVLRSFAAYRQNDLSRASQLLEEALVQLPPDSLRLQSVASLRLGMIYKDQKDWSAAAKALRRAQKYGARSDGLTVALSACGQLAEMFIEQGQLNQAAQLCRHTLESYAERYPQRTIPNLGVCIRLAYVLYEWDQLEAATSYITQGIALSQQIALVWLVVLEGLMRLAWIKHVQGRPDEAAALLRQVIARADQLHATEVELQATAWQARLALAQGDLATASRWAQAYQSQRAARQVRSEVADMTLARILMAQEDWSQALDLLEPMGRTAKESGCWGRLIEVLALKALVYQTRREALALSTLKKALSLAEPEGYVRSFVDQGPALATLLTKIQAHSGRRQAYVRKLLSAFGEQQVSTGPPSVDPFSDRELEVLRLLAAGLKTPEIAAELFLAKSTIKWYLRNLYSKLDVHRRSDAIARARALGLLE